MRTLIRGLADTGITILLSSHNMAEVEETCRHVAIMRRGKIAFEGSMQDLRARADAVEYRLVSNDTGRVTNVLREAPGVGNVRAVGDGIRFDSTPEAVERVTTQLGGMGIGIRQLELPRTALETLFFRLTEVDGAEAMEAAR
jgi:ABC-2 type transport system ATP-binding protein